MCCTHHINGFLYITWAMKDEHSKQLHSKHLRLQTAPPAATFREPPACLKQVLAWAVSSNLNRALAKNKSCSCNQRQHGRQASICGVSNHQLLQHHHHIPRAAVCQPCTAGPFPATPQPSTACFSGIFFKTSSSIY